MKNNLKVDVDISKISFNKKPAPENNIELDTVLKKSYSINYCEEGKKVVEIDITIKFNFAPDVLMDGQVDYKVRVEGETELDETVINHVIKSLDKRIANEVSYISTVCCDMIIGQKMVIPPFFAK